VALMLLLQLFNCENAVVLLRNQYIAVAQQTR
jgi:hypothetical protein